MTPNTDNNHRFSLLAYELKLMNKAEVSLKFSYQRCLELGKKTRYSLQEQERFESLTSRFARLSDIVIQKLFQLIDQIELEDEGTIRDRINHAEKKQLIRSASDFIIIRELRNSIAHEYQEDAITNIFHSVLDKTPLLFNCVTQINQYCKKYPI